MRLTVRLLGWEVFAISTDADAAEEDASSLDGGTTASYPVGFSRRPDEDMGVRPEWGDED